MILFLLGLQSGQIRRCSVGKYGSLVLCDEDLSETLPTDRPVLLEELGRQLCMHVVGMNPQSIGVITDNPSEDSENEVKLIHQDFMLDTNLRVLDVLQQNGAKVLDFVRFECGEVLSEEFENASAVSSAS